MPRCAECGYLALRDLDSRQIAEVEVGVRKDWKLLSVIKGSQGPRYDSKPLCFMHAADLPGEIGHSTPDQILLVVSADRPCASFTRWLHGRTPREHEEMTLSEERRKRDLEWQEERRRADANERDERMAADRAWQEQRQAADKEWQEGWQARQASQSRRFQRQLAILAAAVTVGNGLLGILIGRWLQQPPAPPQPIIIQQPADAKSVP